MKRKVAVLTAFLGLTVGTASAQAVKDVRSVEARKSYRPGGTARSHLYNFLCAELWGS